jgi:hypothetical protein
VTSPYYFSAKQVEVSRSLTGNRQRAMGNYGAGVSTLASRSTIYVGFFTAFSDAPGYTRHDHATYGSTATVSSTGGDDPGAREARRPPRCRTQVLCILRVFMQLLIRITDAAPGPYVMILHAAQSCIRNRGIRHRLQKDCCPVHCKTVRRQSLAINMQAI